MTIICRVNWKSQIATSKMKTQPKTTKIFLYLSMKHTIIVDDEAPKGAELMDIIKQFPIETVEILGDEEDLSDCVPIEVWGEELMAQLEKAYAKKDKKK